MQRFTAWFARFDGPTFVVAAVIYVWWFALVWFHTVIPWWAMLPMGAYVIAWHFSLQHEAIHAFRRVPDWLRVALVYPPIGLWFPFPLYYESHRIHHRNTYLSYPGQDTETAYIKSADWAAMGPIARGFLTANQTMLGKLTLGPFIRLWRLAKRESSLIRAGDRAHLRSWVIHVMWLVVLYYVVSEVAGMPFWQYIVLIAFPGMSLGFVRAFAEHRAAPRPGQRTAHTESHWLWSLLWLNNNLHIAHHLRPMIPWYELPAFCRKHRAKLLEHNGGFVWRGYGEIFRRFLVRPVFVPRHPFK